MASHKFLIGFLLLASATALGNVSIRNGNFYMGYKDLLYPGGFEPRIERVYNSKSGYKGMFGWGWGTEYEVYLKVSADGSVVVFEYGGGAENRFTPEGFKRSDLEDAVAMIVRAAKKTGSLSNESLEASYRRNLLNDAFFRNDEWMKFISQKELKPLSIKVNTKLVSNRFSFQHIKKLPQGYVRVFDSGKTEYFTEDGRLLEIRDTNGNFIKLGYFKDGKMEKLEDNYHRKIFFKYNTKGLLSEVQGVNNQRATYQYDGQDNLVQSKDVAGNIYKYFYDKAHNMTRIGYGDNTTMEMDYYGKDKQQNIKSVKDRDGMITEYEFDTSKGKENSLRVALTIKGKDRKTVSKSSYDYETKVRSDGEEWTYRIVQNIDGQVTDTIYNECCGLPVSITRNGEKVTFAYDGKGRVTEKNSPDETTKLAYHKDFGKVAEVKKFVKRNKKSSWVKYAYDGKGNLTTALNSDKRKVNLVYDLNGRVKSIIDQGVRRIDFKYNEFSRPIEIIDPKMGSIRVQYTSTGEIKSVDSEGGRRIASEISSAFQNLLNMIQPAGVSLAF